MKRDDAAVHNLRYDREWREQMEARHPEWVQAIAAKVGTRILANLRSWTVVETQPGAGMKLQHVGRRLVVLWSLSLEDDGRPWMHVSVSVVGQARLPNRDELGFVKEFVVGDDRYAYEVWPPVDRYVDINDVLHLWAPMFDEPALPEFSHVLPDGRRTI